jgi:hypothetical protein
MEEMYKIGYTVLVALLSAALGIIAYFLKDIRQNIKEKNVEQDEAIECLRDEFSNFKAMLPREYVLRDDYLRTTANLENKMDNLVKIISDLNKNINWLLGRDKDGKPVGKV